MLLSHPHADTAWKTVAATPPPGFANSVVDQTLTFTPVIASTKLLPPVPPRLASEVDCLMPDFDTTPVLEAVHELSALALRTYRVNPGLVEEHANGERRITQGGYGDRQLFELVQNAADELQSSPGGRVQVALTKDHLYCANEGSAVTPSGAETILRMGVSRKRGGQIGRFGVGVKSVLSVTRTPEFFSTSGAFGFDADWSAREILSAVNSGRADRGEPLVEALGDTPVLRLARPLDVDRERAADPVLHELLGWATTVVRLPLLPGAAARLGEDIFHQARSTGDRREFPRLFQLFSHHVGTVRLEDRRQMPYLWREVLVEHRGVHHIIRESRSGAKQVEANYRVFTRPHHVTEESRSGAGELHDRVTIDISWAVPDYTSNDRGVLTVPSERGTFWSFFPTKYPTTLSGALNAAWKTNEDRQNLLDGSSLNRELLRVAAELVVDSLSDLVPAKDPAAFLPLLPGRAKESPNWACEFLTGQIWRLTAIKPSLPDQEGVLRLPKELRIHPVVSPRALELWRSYPGRPTNWVHHSVEADRTRRGKVAHVLDAAGIKEEGSLRTWLEALVEDGKAAASAAAIRLLANLVQDSSTRAEDLAEARKARIVLTERHGLVAPVPGGVFRRADEDGLRDDLVYVHPEISDDLSMTFDLDRIGIRNADTQGRFQSVLDQGFDDYTDESWTRFWQLMRSAGGAIRVSDIRNKVPDISAVIRVKTVVGAFRPLRDCLLPGPVVPADGSRDSGFAVDITFHRDDLTALRDLGMTDRPQRGHRPESEEWFPKYHKAVYDAYCQQLGPTAPRIQLQTLKIDGASVAGPLNLFTRLSEQGRAAFLDALPEDSLVETWVRQEGKNAGTRVAVSSPIRWLLRTYGRVDTSKGLIPLRDAVGPQLKAYEKVLPVAKLSPGKAERLGLPTKVEAVKPERWTELLSAAKASEDPSFVGHAYALLIRVDFDFSEELTVRCRVGDRWEMRPDKDVAVAVSTEEFNELCREGHPALLVNSPEDHEQAEFMISVWGMSRVSEVIEKGLRFVPGGPAVPLVDEYPPLRQRLGTRANGHFLQRCTELEESVRTPSGTRHKPLPSARQESTVLVLENASREEALIAADREFGWRLGPAGCRQILEAQEQQRKNRAHQEKRTRIRHSESVIDKISKLISAEDLKRGLPAGLIDSEIAEAGTGPDLRRLAEMAYNAHGEGILRVHARDIAATYQGAPGTFDGRSKALEFVADLGFPDSFAGARTPSPPEREEVKGPTEFPALHAYQEELASELTKLLQSKRPQRAMLSLPTGAGKTRVTAEGVIRWIRRSGTPDGPILWIAQTEELCEQAVQSWRFVWEKVGADQPLVIDRLWSGNSATPVSGRPHLVVATDAKLRLHLGTAAYDWLRQAALVLVDEAHVAISPLYTEILEHLGLTHRETRRHLVGLTATPFRNNVELTRRLVQRFGNLRLDENIFDGEAITRLQDIGVLAQVEHRQLAGAQMQLNPDELRTIEQFNGFLPKGAEQRLADDQDRNRVLIEEIVRVAKDGPVLVFATSVPHAKFLAAKLGDRGIRAAAIDAATPTAERSKRVEAFRKGELRVITNYGVLSQGFDAPATRAVVIARPVYSANVYQQMIGRGLRGPLNGGKETCLILDVRDNITNFNKDLAFRDFEHLWKKERR